MPIPYDYRYVGVLARGDMEEKTMSKKKQWEWKKFLVGIKRPAIAIIVAAASHLLGADEATAGFVAIVAERAYGSLEFYLKK